MSDDSSGAEPTNFAELEQRTLQAFNRWHSFHEDLIKLGEFATWLSENEHQVDLVSFFVIDGPNTDNYREALGHQTDFLDGLRQMLEDTVNMIDEFQRRQDEQEEQETKE
ncbi:MAG: hypothetical protein CMM50_18400 [Rhodospirillaceae bacterium]|nr:hypothetical protein [Rhodospirillaceae bacterium]